MLPRFLDTCLVFSFILWSMVGVMCKEKCSPVPQAISRVPLDILARLIKNPLFYRRFFSEVLLKRSFRGSFQMLFLEVHLGYSSQKFLVMVLCKSLFATFYGYFSNLLFAEEIVQNWFKRFRHGVSLPYTINILFTVCHRMKFMNFNPLCTFDIILLFMMSTHEFCKI